MSKIKYKVNGYWHTIAVEGKIEAVGFENDTCDCSSLDDDEHLVGCPLYKYE